MCAVSAKPGSEIEFSTEKTEPDDDSRKGLETDSELEDTDSKIWAFQDLYSKGDISEEIYYLNLAKLKGLDSESSEQDDAEEVSYVCPLCNEEVEADATECSSCGTAVQE